MSIDPRRIAIRTLALGAAWTWGLVELVALTRQRWTSARQR